ncbi:MAG: ABC transporter substrate-binding protein [Chloroflexota bacterium]|nr:ABC transporter substrate-binding protein [Chloroflexota bacterium]MED5568134.1 ABC transporter substrate-binding protein [Chloroflexota bacterium]
MKICSLLPSATEILFALGLGDQVTGVSDLCDFPSEANSKPVVSRSKVDPSVMSSEEVEASMARILASGENPYELDQEWLVRESPDVVLTQDLCHVCEVDEGQVTGVVAGMEDQPQIVVLQPKTFEGILDSIIQVGRACDAERQAAQVIAAMRQRVQAIQEKLRPGTERPRVFSIEGINPLVVGGHWIPDMLYLAGGNQDMFAPGCPAKRLDWSEVREFDPDKLFIDLCSSDLARNLQEAPWLERREGWRELSSVQSGEVYLLDHSYFSRPGPRTVEGVELLAELTHPNLFSGLAPKGAVVKLDAERYAGHPDGTIGKFFLPYP